MGSVTDRRVWRSGVGLARNRDPRPNKCEGLAQVCERKTRRRESSHGHHYWSSYRSDVKRRQQRGSSFASSESSSQASPRRRSSLLEEKSLASSGPSAFPSRHSCDTSQKKRTVIWASDGDSASASAWSVRARIALLTAMRISVGMTGDGNIVCAGHRRIRPLQS